MNQEFRLYRYKSDEGSAKEWAVRYIGDGNAMTRWGEAGHLTEELMVPNATAAMGEYEKELNGYRYVGQIRLVGDGGRYVRCRRLTRS